MLRNTSLPKRLGRYLIEIIIIIIGITLSFALDDWDKRQSEQKDYKGYLENLLQDITIDSSQMVNDFTSYHYKSEAISFFLRFDSWENPDSLMELGSGLSTLSNFVEFLPNDNTYQMLSSTGGFKVFSNRELVSEMIHLYTYDYAYIEMMGKQANIYRVDYLEPFLIDNIFYEDQITFPKIRTDVRKILGDRKFKNICLVYQEASYSVQRSYSRAIKRLRKVHKLLLAELALL